MKLCDKLPVLRKAKNFSQEQLAEKLDISRQAVAKWETGASYPEMAKIMQLCKILDCSLDDLVDDDAIGNKTPNVTKFSLELYVKEFLDFITQIFNMFWSMSAKQKIKCIFEICLMLLIFFLVWLVLGFFINQIIYSLTNFLPDFLALFIRSLVEGIYGILGVIVIAIIVFHIFKIRYLDYFVTIKDSDRTERVVEKLVEEEPVTEKNEKKKSKIIIRDPQHSTYNFFIALGKTMLFFLKIIVMFVIAGCCLSFVGIIFVGVATFMLGNNNQFFVGLLAAIIGAGLLNYLMLELMFNFIFNQMYHLKRVFIMFASALIMIGGGLGVSTADFLNFEQTEEQVTYTTSDFEIKMSDKPDLPFLDDKKTEIVIDESQSDIKVVVEHDSKNTVIMDKVRPEFTNVAGEFNSSAPTIKIIRYNLSYYNKFEEDMFKILIEDFKARRTRKNSNYGLKKITVYVSTANFNQLRELADYYQSL